MAAKWRLSYEPIKTKITTALDHNFKKSQNLEIRISWQFYFYNKSVDSFFKLLFACSLYIQKYFLILLTFKMVKYLENEERLNVMFKR